MKLYTHPKEEADAVICEKFAGLTRAELIRSGMPVFYNDDYTSPVYAFDTTRKSAEIARALGNDLLSDPGDMKDVATFWISEAHSAEYSEALQVGEPKDLSESNGFEWDYGIWEMARSSTAGVMSACHRAFETKSIAGSLSSGLHHARHDGGMGFCTVNGLAIAAHAFPNLNITILDFDAHCGGGTVSMLRELGIDDRVQQYDISTNYFDSYEEDVSHFILEARNDTECDRAVESVLRDVVNFENTDLVLYNAGTDPYPEISHEALARRDALVFETVSQHEVPCAFVLAGGYTAGQSMSSLVMSHLATIEAASRFTVS